MWIISSARHARFAFSHLGLDKAPKTVREYRISGIGHYLISPSPLNVPCRLVGCELHQRPSKWASWIQNALKWFGRQPLKNNPPLLLVTDFLKPGHSPVDERLNRHIQALQGKLKPFDSFFQALDNVNIHVLADVVGICDDEAGNRSQLLIDGEPSKQLEYVRAYTGKEINVRLKRANFADGLFEMKGFDFRDYDPSTSYRLIRFIHDGLPRACVLNDDHSIAFWLDNAKLVNYLQLFEFSIRQNRHMRKSLLHCVRGKAVPMRLMFNHALEIDYSQAALPPIFQEAIGDRSLADHAGRLIKPNLNLHQVGVSLNSLAINGSDEGELCTDISILQNLRALEPIKAKLPQLFAEMTKRSSRSDSGEFYQLAAMRGVNNEG